MVKFPTLLYLIMFQIKPILNMQAHFAPNSKFNFHKYIKRSLEDDFKVVVGIRFLSSILIMQCTFVYRAKDFNFLFAVFHYGFLPSFFCFSMSTVNFSLPLSLSHRHTHTFLGNHIIENFLIHFIGA